MHISYNFYNPFYSTKVVLSGCNYCLAVEARALNHNISFTISKKEEVLNIILTP